MYGYTIIDSKAEDEQTINKYINEVEQNGSGAIILKDKVILKNNSVSGTINYNYNEILSQMGITEFTKQDVINYANSSKIGSLYVSIALTIFIYAFIMYFITSISNAVFLGVFGYLSAICAKIKMRFVAIFNMTIYALTLSTILNMIYIAINIFTKFNMQYFQVMYVSVAAIYLVAAIFLLKSDFMKRQAELMKLAEAQELIKKEMEQKEEEKQQEEQREKEKKERKEKDKKEEKKDDTDKEEPAGSNA